MENNNLPITCIQTLIQTFKNKGYIFTSILHLMSNKTIVQTTIEFQCSTCILTFEEYLSKFGSDTNEAKIINYCFNSEEYKGYFDNREKQFTKILNK